MDEDALVIIARFMEIYEEEGPEAATAWAEEETKRIEGPKPPDLRIVSK
jgi:hypothetical protein